MMKKRLAFVDSRIALTPAQIAGFSSDTEIFLLDSRLDGFSQIQQALAGRRGIDAIYLLAASEEAVPYLGATPLDADLLANHAVPFGAMAGALSDSGNLALGVWTGDSTAGGQAFFDAIDTRLTLSGEALALLAAELATSDAAAEALTPGAAWLTAQPAAAQSWSGAETAAAPHARPPLPDKAFGAAAIDALGTHLAGIASAHGMTEERLREIFQQDPSLGVDQTGELFYVDQENVAAAPLATIDSAPVLAAPLADTFLLHSNPGANRVIFLDFDGHVLSGNAWTAGYNGGSNIIAPAWDTDGNAASFGDGERTVIQEVWRRVAEDYAAFDVDVTTQAPGEAAITRSDGFDTFFGTRALISPISSFIGNYGGVAYLGTFDDIGDYYKPALIFPENLSNNAKFIAEAVSHEVGHNLNLNHDGTSAVGYYQGHGSGDTGWAPIMGVGYNQNLSQWSRGEYADANNTEDDLAIIQSYGLSYRADDYGNSIGAAAMVDAGGTFELNGKIERNTDIDYFRIDAGAGAMSLSVAAATSGPNLDLEAILYDEFGGEIARNNPIGSLAATIDVTVDSGAYFLAVHGVGEGDPATGYSNYGSLGEYSVVGEVAPSDVPNDTSTDAIILVGESLTGNIEVADDSDWFAVSLIAGQSYSFDLRGANSGSGTLADPVLRLLDSTGLVSLADNDDLSLDPYYTLDSRVVYTAVQTGVYFLSANSFSFYSATGDYQLSARLSSSPVNLIGGTSADDLFGDLGNDSLYGDAGDDILYGGSGNDALYGQSGNDTLDGGKGWDYARYDGASTAVNVNLATGTASGAEGIDTLIGIEAVYGGKAGDSLTGNGFDNGLYGGKGSDTLTGGAGNDILDGGVEIDTLIGGTGNDTYVIDVAGDIVSETSTLATEIDTVQSAVSWTLGLNLENLTLTGTSAINGTGNTRANTLTGNSGANVLNGGTGSDRLIGGAGGDTYVVDVATDIVTETSTLASEIDSVQSAVTWTLGANLEKLTLTGTAAINGTGNTLANTLTGNSAANRLDGGAGNDVLNGMGGIDTLIGGAGNDTYVVDVAGDIVTETSTLATEIDTVQSAVAWTLGATLENLTLTGAAVINGTGNTLANTLTGNSAANRLDGGAGNDVLNGMGGIDTLIGGAGNDTYFVDVAGDIVTETSTLVTEIDTVQSAVTWTLGARLENLTLTGSTAINGTGNTLANTLTGNTGANRLDAGAGNDVLDGRAGIDTLIGGAGNDTYVVDVVGDIVTETSTLASEIDTVQSAVTWTLGANLEKLTLIGAAAINGTGNALANTVLGNNNANILNGGLGNDTLTGGAGSDFFLFNSALAGNRDTITDFNVVADTIRLENTGIFTALTTLGTLASTAFVAGAGLSAGQDASDRIIYNTTSGAVYYDADGSGATVAVQFATLVGVVGTVSAADFVVV